MLHLADYQQIYICNRTFFIQGSFQFCAKTMPLYWWSKIYWSVIFHSTRTPLLNVSMQRQGLVQGSAKGFGCCIDYISYLQYNSIVSIFVNKKQGQYWIKHVARTTAHERGVVDGWIPKPRLLEDSGPQNKRMRVCHNFMKNMKQKILGEVKRFLAASFNNTP